MLQTFVFQAFSLNVLICLIWSWSDAPSSGISGFQPVCSCRASWSWAVPQTLMCQTFSLSVIIGRLGLGAMPQVLMYQAFSLFYYWIYVLRINYPVRYHINRPAACDNKARGSATGLNIPPTQAGWRPAIGQKFMSGYFLYFKAPDQRDLCEIKVQIISAP